MLGFPFDLVVEASCTCGPVNTCPGMLRQNAPRFLLNFLVTLNDAPDIFSKQR